MRFEPPALALGLDAAGGFAGWLEAALRALAREAPAAYERLAATAGAEGVRFEVAGPPVVLRFGARRHALERDPAPAAVAVRADPATIAALLGGGLTLLDAIERERLALRGEPGPVLRFEQALGALAEGASRAASFAALLETLRADG